jgi:hypothetical protein
MGEPLDVLKIGCRFIIIFKIKRYNMRNKNLTMKERSILKYDLLIAWAKCQQYIFKNKETDSDVMLASIGIDWYTDSCEYCEKHFDIASSCIECPLSLIYKTKTKTKHKTNAVTRRTVWCCDGLWLKMSRSRTWGEWAKNAELVRDYIKENG